MRTIYQFDSSRATSPRRQCPSRGPCWATVRACVRACIALPYGARRVPADAVADSVIENIGRLDTAETRCSPPCSTSW
jgi:hypothetical protein